MNVIESAVKDIKFNPVNYYHFNSCKTIETLGKNL